MPQTDLNCDLGESFGVYSMGMDEAVMPLITSANIACGWHAGDPLVMAKSIASATRHGVGVGAHPGLPDRMGFGRRPMAINKEEIKAYMIYQIGALAGFCKAAGVSLRHVKPHGALYNMAIADADIFSAIAEAVAAVDPSLYLVTLAGKDAQKRLEIGRRSGVRVILEAFADRAYTPEGALAPRHLPGAVIADPDEAADRAVRMITERRVQTTDGSFLPLFAQTICVHGDTPSALTMIERLRQRLSAAKIQLVPMQEAA